MFSGIKNIKLQKTLFGMGFILTTFVKFFFFTGGGGSDE